MSTASTTESSICLLLRTRTQYSHFGDRMPVSPLALSSSQSSSASRPYIFLLVSMTHGSNNFYLISSRDWSSRKGDICVCPNKQSDRDGISNGRFVACHIYPRLVAFSPRSVPIDQTGDLRDHRTFHAGTSLPRYLPPVHNLFHN